MTNYILEIWIDARKNEVEEVKKELLKKLTRFPSVVIDDEELPNEMAVILRVCAEDPRAISCCYNLYKWDRNSKYIARDDLSEEVRAKAFPILAQIEISLRRFINRSMTEVVGFEWWETRMPSSIGRKISGIENRRRRDTDKHPPLDYSFFEDLVNFVTAKFQRWPDDKQLTAGNLSEILTNVDKITDLRNVLLEYQKEISLWDDVFSIYFDDKEHWTNLQDGLLNDVIPVRHKVVHHRDFVQEYEIEKLKEIKTNLEDTLRAAKPKLSNKEREKAKDILDGIIQPKVNNLPGDMPEIIHLLYGLEGNDHTVDEVAKMLGISPEEVEKQHKAALRIMRHPPRKQ
jgi:hypothetical protein